MKTISLPDNAARFGGAYEAARALAEFERLRDSMAPEIRLLVGTHISLPANARYFVYTDGWILAESGELAPWHAD